MTTQPVISKIDPLLNVKQTAKRLTISVATVRRLTKSGDLPQPVRIGGSVRWRSSDLQNHLEAQT